MVINKIFWSIKMEKSGKLQWFPTHYHSWTLSSIKWQVKIMHWIVVYINWKNVKCIKIIMYVLYTCMLLFSL